MLDQRRKTSLPMTTATVPPVWDRFQELHRLFKENAMHALEDEDLCADLEVKQTTGNEQVTRKASAEA